MYALFHTYLTKALFLRTKAEVEGWDGLAWILEFESLRRRFRHELDLVWWVEETVDQRMVDRFKDCFFGGMPVEAGARWLCDHIQD